MASTYFELYSDFQDKVKLYHKSATVTERSFMRYLTEAMQDFQKRTKIVETEKQLFAQSKFDLGDDVLEIIEVCDENDNKFFSMDYAQFRTELEKLGQDISSIADSPVTAIPVGFLFQPGNRAETIDKYDAGRHPPPTGNTQYGQHTRIFCISYNRILFYPNRDDQILELRYIPDLHTFSSRSTQWKAWFDNNGENFEQLFKERGLWGTISQYESAILQKAIAGYVGAQLNNEQAYFALNEYKSAINLATDNKISTYTFGVTPYSISPF